MALGPHTILLFNLISLSAHSQALILPFLSKPIRLPQNIMGATHSYEKGPTGAMPIAADDQDIANIADGIASRAKVLLLLPQKTSMLLWSSTCDLAYGPTFGVEEFTHDFDLFLQLDSKLILGNRGRGEKDTLCTPSQACQK